MDADSMLLDEYAQHAAAIVMAAPSNAPVLAFPSMSFPPMRLNRHSASSWMAACLDSVWLGICMGGAGRPTPVKFPTSVYSLRLDVMLDAGVVSSAEGVGEDMMMAIRAYCSRRCLSVFVPFPFGSQRVSSLVDRIRQTMRHGYGTVGLRATLLGFVQRPSVIGLLLVWQAIEVSCFFALVAWMCLNGRDLVAHMSAIEQIIMLCSGVVSVVFIWLIQEQGARQELYNKAEAQSLVLVVLQIFAFLVTFAIAAQMYAALNLVAIFRMGIAGPAVVSHVRAERSDS